METNLFNQGIRPAVSVGLSVSRVGGAAQTKAVRSVAGSLRLDLAQFRELAAFAQFSSDLDTETKQKIERGQRLTELLKQPQYTPYSIWEQTVSLMAATNGAFDSVPVKNIKEAQAKLLHLMSTEHKKLTVEINKGAKPDEKTKETVMKVAKDVAEGFKEITNG